MRNGTALALSGEYARSSDNLWSNGAANTAWNGNQKFFIIDEQEDIFMKQMTHATQDLMTSTDKRKFDATDGTGELLPEGLGATEQELMQLHRRRRIWRAAGGAIAGMMAARRAQ